jgi:hypothetical protein
VSQTKGNKQKPSLIHRQSLSFSSQQVSNCQIGHITIDLIERWSGITPRFLSFQRFHFIPFHTIHDVVISPHFWCISAFFSPKLDRDHSVDASQNAFLTEAPDPDH